MRRGSRPQADVSQMHIAYGADTPEAYIDTIIEHAACNDRIGIVSVSPSEGQGARSSSPEMLAAFARGEGSLQQEFERYLAETAQTAF